MDGHRNEDQVQHTSHLISRYAKTKFPLSYHVWYK